MRLNKMALVSWLVVVLSSIQQTVSTPISIYSNEKIAEATRSAVLEQDGSSGALTRQEDHQQYSIVHEEDEDQEDEEEVDQLIEQSKQELSEELREEVDHVKQLTKEQLEEELQMLEKEKLLVEQFEEKKTNSDYINDRVDELKNSTTPAHVSVVSPIKSVLGAFGELFGVVLDTVGGIVKDSLDLVDQVTKSEPFNQHMSNVTRSVNTLVEESAGLFNKVVEIKYKAGDKIISRINTSIQIRNQQKKKLTEEEEKLEKKINDLKKKLEKKKYVQDNTYENKDEKYEEKKESITFEEAVDEKVR